MEVIMFRIALLVVAVALTALLFGGACKPRQAEPISTAEVKQKIEEASTTATEYTKQQKEEYVAAMQREMTDLKTGLDKLKTQARAATAESKTQLDREVKVLDQKWAQAEHKFDQLKAASIAKWWDLKAGVDRAVQDLRQSLPGSNSRNG
jgi:uncharacterized protein involved in copper resistance